jgi:hypothetical protein
MTIRPAYALVFGVYLVLLGVCTGVALDRMRFDRQRSEVIGRYEQALREWHTAQMSVEKQLDGEREALP